MLFFFWISGFLVVSKNAKFSGFLVDRATTFGGFTKIKLATLATRCGVVTPFERNRLYVVTCLKSN